MNQIPQAKHALTVQRTKNKIQAMTSSALEAPALHDKSLSKMQIAPIVRITKQLTPQLTIQFAIDLNVLTTKS